MEKDLLDGRVFLSNSGKDYRTPARLDKKAVADYFAKIGYMPLEVNQAYRNGHGRLLKNGRVFFFKMASTPDIGERTYNEMVWNINIENAIKNSGIRLFSVPLVCDCGYFENKFYFITRYYDGRFLAYKKPPRRENLINWVEKIVECNIFFLNLKLIRFPRDENEFASTKSFSKEFYEQDLKLIKDLREFGLEEILEEEKLIDKIYNPGITHGDFVPWHMIDRGHSFVLIDGEHGSSVLPRYYDIVYFYHRVYTGAEAPEIAKIYLNKIMGTLSPSEKDIFKKSIRPLLASRIITGFWRAKNYKDNLAFNLKLRDAFIKNEFL
ncbi:MAG: hypothetical protein ABIH39_04870 [Candidatus Margulisiibacteriota bacterium]